MNQETQPQDDSGFIRYPSTNQLRNVVQHVQRQTRFAGLDEKGEAIFDHTKTLPTLAFQGTVKLHGTNAAVVISNRGVHFQSRERILTEEADNAGFYTFMKSRMFPLMNLRDSILGRFNLWGTEHPIAVYGEWCGGNIQPNVAIAGLPKMFVIFGIEISGNWFTTEGLVTDHTAGIYNIFDFPSFMINIDFNQPELAQAELIKLTQEVEEACPVGRYFGKVGIGEGIVWRCVTRPQPEYWFKVKGEKHSASKVKTLAAVDIEKVNSINEFVQKTVTENRLNQGVFVLKQEMRKPMDQTSTGDFIRWIVGDIHKEEADTLQASGLEAKDVNGKISAAAKAWYFNELNKQPA